MPLVELSADARRLSGHYDTIDAIFDVIDGVMARSPDKADIQFDDRYGFPVVADLDPRFRMFDDELFIRVIDFKAVDR
jgi:hypothetical protein